VYPYPIKPLSILTSSTLQLFNSSTLLLFNPSTHHFSPVWQSNSLKNFINSPLKQEDQMQIGFIGMKYSGKSTLFQLLTGDHYETMRTHAGEYFRGNVLVPDSRIDALSTIYQPKKTTYTYFECLDVMGLPSGKKHDQSAKYLEAVRQTDGLLAVLRVFDGFDDEGNPARIDPVGDIRSLEEELIFTDLVVMESRLEKLDTMKKRGAPQYDKEEHELLSRMHGHLEEEKPLRSMDLSADDHKKIRGFKFLSLKPLMAVLNCDEDHYKNKNK